MQAAGQVEQLKMQHATEMEQMKQAAETERAKYKADLDAQVRLQIAQMQDNQGREAREFEAARSDMEAAREMEKESAEKEDKEEESNGMKEAVQQIAEVAAVMGKAVEQLSKPRKRVIERDPKSGRAVGMVEVD